MSLNTLNLSPVASTVGQCVCVCVHAFKCVSACVYVVVKVLGVWLLSVASSIKQGPEVCVRVTNDVTCVSAD